jgi:hypothetical protein
MTVRNLLQRCERYERTNNYAVLATPLSASSPQRSYFLDELPAERKFPGDLGTRGDLKRPPPRRP